MKAFLFEISSTKKICLKKLLELNSVVASSRSNSVVQTTLSIEDWIQTRGGIITV